MSMTTSRARPSGLKPNRDWRSGDPGQAGRGPAQFGSSMLPREPEWKTERWKRDVEAEARSRLKKSIRQVGSRR